MDQLIELLEKIQELAGIGIEALQQASGGGETKGGPPEEGAPPEAAAPPPQG